MKLKRLIFFVYVLGWTLLLTLVMFPLLLGIGGILDRRVIAGGIVISFVLAFCLFLYLRNDAKYNSFLECFFWDAKIKLSFIILLSISLYVYYQPTINDYIKHKEFVERVKKQISEAKKEIQKIEKIIVIHDEIPTDISGIANDIRAKLIMLANNSLSLSEKRVILEKMNLNQSQIDKKLVKFDDIALNLLRLETEMSNLEINLDEIVSGLETGNDIHSNIKESLVHIEQLFIEVNKLIKYYKSLPKFLSLGQNTISIGVELVNIESQIEDLRKEKDEFKTRIKSLKEKGNDLQDKLKSNLNRDSEDLLELFDQQESFDSAVNELKYDFNHYITSSRWKRGSDIVLIKVEYFQNYWDIIHAKRQKLYQEAKQISLIQLDHIVNKNEVWRKDVHNKLVQSKEGSPLLEELYITNFKRLTISYELDHFQKWRRAYNHYLQHKDNIEYIWSDIQGAKELNIDVLNSKIRDIIDPSDSYHFERYFLILRVPNKAIAQFQTDFNKFTKDAKQLEITNIKKFEKLHTRDVKKNLKLYKKTSRDIERFREEKDEIGLYYKKTFEKINSNLVEVSERIFSEHNFIVREYQIVEKGHPESVKEAVQKIESDLKKLFTKIDKFFSKSYYLFAPKIEVLSEELERISDKIDKYKKLIDKFNTNFSQTTIKIERLHGLTENWMALLYRFEGGWIGSNLKKCDSNGENRISLDQIRDNLNNYIESLKQMEKRLPEEPVNLGLKELETSIRKIKQQLSKSKNILYWSWGILFLIVFIISFSVVISIKKVSTRKRIKLLAILTDQGFNDLLTIIRCKKELLYKRQFAVDCLRRRGSRQRRVIAGNQGHHLCRKRTTPTCGG